MKNFSLSVVSDLIFTAFSSFILSFALLNYFMPRISAVIFSLVLCAVFTSLFFKRKIKKSSTEKLKKSEQKKLEETVLELNLMDEKVALSLFSKAFASKNLKVEKIKDYLYLPEKETFVFVKCDLDGATKKDVVRAYNLSNGKLSEIYTTTEDAELLEFAGRFGGKVKILGRQEIYKLLCECNLLPKVTVPSPPKRKNKELIKMTFTRKKSKSYFFLGLGFLFMSYFVSIKLYYILFGTGFMLFSIACRFFAPSEN